MKYILLLLITLNCYCGQQQGFKIFTEQQMTYYKNINANAEYCIGDKNIKTYEAMLMCCDLSGYNSRTLEEILIISINSDENILGTKIKENMKQRKESIEKLHEIVEYKFKQPFSSLYIEYMFTTNNILNIMKASLK